VNRKNESEGMGRGWRKLEKKNREKMVWFRNIQRSRSEEEGTWFGF